MRDLTLRSVLVAVGLLAAPAAWALPWHVDLADSDTFKAYEHVMAPLPEGVMSQDNMLTPVSYRANYQRGSAEGEALVSPLDAGNPMVLAQGERMYNVYCTPCHGDGVKLGPVAAPGRYPAVAVLAGQAGRLNKISDGWVYLTVRNGGGLMPGYGHAMSEEEIWAVVAWMRATLPDSKAPVPEPVVESAGEESPE
jgi:mono/diheme cytochrome c family protein